MLIFKRSLEEHVWTGYRHTQAIYDIATAGARTPQEADFIRALEPTFSKLPEGVLHSWVQAGVDGRDSERLRQARLVPLDLPEVLRNAVQALSARDAGLPER